MDIQLDLDADEDILHVNAEANEVWIEPNNNKVIFHFEDAAVRRTSSGVVQFEPDHTTVTIGKVAVLVGTKRISILFEGNKLWDGVIPNRDGHG